MKILIAPDKFKGSLSAMEVCQAISAGLQKDEIYLHAMADGGDGSLEVIGEHLDLKQQIIETIDPLGRPINTFYYSNSKTAFIEMAKASGLVLLNHQERNPLKTSTLGTGMMIADAISKGFIEIYLFLGGSATHDGGMGIASALGIGFYNENKSKLLPCGENLSKVDSIVNHFVFDFEKIKFTLLCDVNNTLFGTDGAAQVYAPQKGADEKMVELLDNGLKHFSEKLFKYSDIEVADLPGSGAAGGIAASLVSIFNAEIKSGFKSFAEITKLELQIQKADLIISGEGRLDSQSLQGKVVGGVAQLCKKYEKPLLLFVGKNELSEHEENILGAKKILSVFDRANDLDDSMKNASIYLKDLAQMVQL